MEVGDDVPLAVPDEAGAGAARDLLSLRLKGLSCTASEVMNTTDGEACWKRAMVAFSCSWSCG